MQQSQGTPLSLLDTRLMFLECLTLTVFSHATRHHREAKSLSDGSFYQCAVAEAHGHGPVAYLVRNEDLDNVIDERELDKGDYQGLLDRYEELEEEFFYDDNREVGDITPINRLRLRKYSSPKFNMTIAVPARQFMETTEVLAMLWWIVLLSGRKAQEDALKKMKDDEDMLSDGKI